MAGRINSGQFGNRSDTKKQARNGVQAQPREARAKGRQNSRRY